MNRLGVLQPRLLGEVEAGGVSRTRSRHNFVHEYVLKNFVLLSDNHVIR